MEGLIKTTPDKEKARSILKMVEDTLDMINSINGSKFPSNIVKEYYDVLRELVSVILLLDGLKTKGEGAHRKLIEYLAVNYKEFTEAEIMLLEELRTIRNKIAYDGFFVTEDYLNRKRGFIKGLVKKLNTLSKRKLGVV